MDCSDSLTATRSISVSAWSLFIPPSSQIADSQGHSSSCPAGDLVTKAAGFLYAPNCSGRGLRPCLTGPDPAGTARVLKIRSQG
jgi:hypothetical protein